MAFVNCPITFVRHFKWLFFAMLFIFLYYYCIIKPIANLNHFLFMPKNSEYMTEQQKKFVEFLEDKKLTAKLVKEMPTKYVPFRERIKFHFIQAVCFKKLTIKVKSKRYVICKTRHRFENPIYLISQYRDRFYEKALRKILGKRAIIKVFHAENRDKEHPTGCDYGVVNYVQRIKTMPYTDAVDPKEWELGIHDLLDKFDELREIEFIQYEAKDINDPIIFSIVRHGISQYLLHLRACTYPAMRYVIKRFIFNMYYPYSIIRHASSSNSSEKECFISFVTKFSFSRYHIDYTRNVTYYKTFH